MLCCVNKLTSTVKVFTIESWLLLQGWGCGAVGETGQDQGREHTGESTSHDGRPGTASSLYYYGHFAVV